MKQLEEPRIASVFNAPIDVILSDTDVLQPDLAILRSERLHFVTDRGIEGPPDIVVEILSPNSRTMDRRVKPRVYARYAIPEYWIVDGDIGQVEIHRLGADSYALDMRFYRDALLVTQSFPEVKVDLAHVFRP